MGRTWKQVRDAMLKAKKGQGRAPKLSEGNYKLLIKAARLIRDEESKEETDPDLVLYQGLGITCSVLEATPGGNPVGSDVDVALWIDAPEKWMRDRNYAKLRAFVETTTGEDMADLSEDFVDELDGFVVFCQVEINDKGYNEYLWSHVPQTPEEVLARREGVE